MKSIKQNMLLILVGISLALSAFCTVFDATAFVYDFSTEFQSVENTYDHFDRNSSDQAKYFLDDRAPARALLNARRPFQQMHFRHQRGNSVQGFVGRDIALQVRPGNHPEKKAATHGKICDRYPSNSIFCTAKEYYVFTLKRILC